MAYLNIDYFIIGALLLITLTIGLKAGRGIQHIREYALANKMYGPGALALTFIATDIAGETILDMAGAVGNDGIIMAVTLFGGVTTALIMQAIFFAPKMIYFDQCITMGDIIGGLYGRSSQIVTGLLSFFTAICIAGMEITVLGILCESLIGIDYRWGVGIGGLLLAIYAAYGGIKSVTATDVFQFLVLLTVLPMITIIALKHAGGIKTVLMEVPVTQFQLASHPKFSSYLTLFLSLAVFQFSVIDPALMQRLLMGKTKRQLRNQLFTISAFYPALMLTLILIGLAGMVLYPTEGHGVNVIPKIINNLLPVGIKGVAIAGLFSVTMATADSFLHATGLTLVHDVIKPLFDKVNIVINELRWVQYATVLAGLIAIIVGLARASDLYGLVLISYKFTGPLLAFPLFAGIMGLKPDKHACYIATGTTLIAFALCSLLLTEEQSYLSPLITVIVNGITFLGTHFVRNNGFTVISHREKDMVEYLWKPRKKNIVVYLKQFIPTPKWIISYSQQKVEKYGAPYMLLGLFGIVNYIVPYFMWEDVVQNYDLMLYLRFIGALSCGLLVVKEKWPKSLLPYLPTFWHLILLYCLPFTSTIMFLLTQGSIEWLVNVTITIMFMVVLVDWLTFLLLTAIGIASGCLFYTQVVGPINLQIDFSTGYLLVYQGIFATLIGLIFARRKQLRLDTLALQNKQLATNHEETTSELLASCKDRARFTKTFRESGAPALASLVRLSKEIVEKTKKGELTQSVIQKSNQLHGQLSSIALHLDRLDHRATGYLRLETDTITIDTFLQAVQEKLHAKGLDKGIRWKKMTQYKAVQCDEAKIETLLVNSISFIRAVGGEEIPILLALEDTQLGYQLNSVTPDYIKQVAALRITITTESMLPTLEEQYLAQMNEDTYSMPETPTALPLVANERIIRAHYGYNNTLTNGNELTQIYAIPIKLREVRSRDMDSPAMELGAEIVRADDTYPGAQEQEAAFLQAVQEHTQADLELVRKAIELIKQYHGPVCRNSGEPFYLHPLAVAHIALDYNQDEATVLGALLHDTVEDTSLTIDQVEICFNKEVRNIVDGVTHLDSYKGTFYKVKLSPHENIRMLLEAVDNRALYVKMADRMHNMRTIQYKSYTSQRRTAEETLLFFVPLAAHLGLQEAASELKKHSLAVLTEHTA